MSSRRFTLLFGATACGLYGAAAQAAPNLNVLVIFDGTNGSGPVAGLVLDQNGNLYGTTARNPDAAPGQEGTVFELSGYNHRIMTTLHTGGYGYGDGITVDQSGNLYGTDSAGGPPGRGSNFKLSGPKHQTYNDVFDFSGNYFFPHTELTFVAPGQSARPNVPYTSGPLFGLASTIYRGGGSDGSGDDILYELSGPKHGTFKVVHDFASSSGDAIYTGPLVADGLGNLFGVEYDEEYGATDVGTIYEVSGADHQTFTTLATFDTSITGADPVGRLTFDQSGNLYGVTQTGGPAGGGTVFELSGSDHQLTSLVAFNSQDGSPSVPNASLAIDGAGNLFGTTLYGGNPNFYAGEVNDTLGVIFELSADHRTFKVVHALTALEGGNPASGLVADRAGNLYGTTYNFGSDGLGTVFKLSNAGFVPFPD